MIDRQDTSPNSPFQVLRSLKLEALWCLSMMIYSSNKACEQIIFAETEFMGKQYKDQNEFRLICLDKS